MSGKYAQYWLAINFETIDVITPTYCNIFITFGNSF